MGECGNCSKILYLSFDQKPQQCRHWGAGGCTGGDLHGAARHRCDPRSKERFWRGLPWSELRVARGQERRVGSGQGLLSLIQKGEDMPLYRYALAYVKII